MEPKLCNREDKLDAVIKSLAYVALQVGIKEKQLPEVVHNTAEFILKRFSMLTAKEILLAFEMNAAGDYEKKHEHFQQMNMEYVGAVLNSYRRLKRQSFIHISKPEGSQYQHESDGGRSSYLAVLKYVEENKEVPKVWDWQLVYNYMTGAGMVKESNEWKDNFMEHVRSIVLKEKLKESQEAKNDILRAKIHLKYNESSLIDRCRAEYVKEYLSKHITP